MAVTAEAGYDATAANALATIGEDRREALNGLLEPAGVKVDADEPEAEPDRLGRGSADFALEVG